MLRDQCCASDHLREMAVALTVDGPTAQHGCASDPHLSQSSGSRSAVASLWPPGSGKQAHRSRSVLKYLKPHVIDEMDIQHSALSS